DDVRVLEVRENLHLVQEQPAALLTPGELGVEHLERDAPLREALLALVDLAHAAFPDQAADEVVTELFHLGRSLPRRPRVLLRTYARAARRAVRPPASSSPALSKCASHPVVRLSGIRARARRFARRRSGPDFALLLAVMSFAPACNRPPAEPDAPASS